MFLVQKLRMFTSLQIFPYECIGYTMALWPNRYTNTILSIYILVYGLPKVIFLTVAEGKGKGGKTLALEVEAEGEGKGLVFCIYVFGGLLKT